MSLSAADAGATRALGARLARAWLAADEAGPVVVGLEGDLGAGKTTLVGGLLAALGHEGPTRSPTYTLVEPYRLAGHDVSHCDLYRLRSPDELEDLGLRDLLTARSLLLVEWPERAGDRLSQPDLSLRIAYAAAGRELVCSATTPAGERVLRCFGSDAT